MCGIATLRCHTGCPCSCKSSRRPPSDMITTRRRSLVSCKEGDLIFSKDLPRELAEKVQRAIAERHLVFLNQPPSNGQHLQNGAPVHPVLPANCHPQPFDGSPGRSQLHRSQAFQQHPCDGNAEEGPRKTQRGYEDCRRPSGP
ncbi:hypothetical protein GOP47_0015620 [Adiantum capillus-veneris]|uniref:Uncharacterized protein n=1 Tax=Adiantum capillus-veneris TaxID=13818 RepID=A0A9D4UK13_ADICA|nr:hypothetical protein GOP47_0015620 [Adiantum capillus-veneris]